MQNWGWSSNNDRIICIINGVGFSVYSPRLRWFRDQEMMTKLSELKLAGGSNQGIFSKWGECCDWLQVFFKADFWQLLWFYMWSRAQKIPAQPHENTPWKQWKHVQAEEHSAPKVWSYKDSKATKMCQVGGHWALTLPELQEPLENAPRPRLGVWGVLYWMIPVGLSHPGYSMWKSQAADLWAFLLLITEWVRLLKNPIEILV